jgi:Calpain family cysteine protease/Calpain large subunit, domain III
MPPTRRRVQHRRNGYSIKHIATHSALAVILFLCTLHCYGSSAQEFHIADLSEEDTLVLSKPSVSTESQSVSAGELGLGLTMLASSTAEDIERRAFLFNLLTYMLPAVVFVTISMYLLSKSRFRISYFSTWVALRQWPFVQNRASFERHIGWVTLALRLLAVVFPLTLICVWGIVAYVESGIGRLFGISVLFVGNAIMITVYGAMQWRASAWRLSRSVISCFLIACLFVFTYAIWAVFLVEPYTYVGISAVFLAINMFPMVHLTYLATSSRRIKQFSLYQHVGFNETIPSRLLSPEVCKLQTADHGGDSVQALGIDTQLTAGLARKPMVDLPSIDDEDAAGTAANDTNDTKDEQQLVDIQDASAIIAAADNDSGAADIDETAVTRQHRVRQYFVLYGCALLVLLAYALTVLYRPGNHDSEGVGFITAGAVLVLDITVFICVLGGKLESATSTASALTASRVALIAFGDTYWFVGHAIMFLLLALLFGTSAIQYWVPLNTVENRKDRLLAELSADAQDLETRRSQTGVGASSIAHTRAGEAIRRNVDIVALGVLTAFFAADIGISAKYNDEKLNFQKSHDQYLSGLLAIFLAAVLLATYALRRVFANNQYFASPLVLGLCALLWAFTLGCGGWLYALTDSVIIISLCAFVPPIVFCMVYSYVQWQRNDYHVILPSHFRSPPKAPFWTSFINGYLPREDYILSSCMFTTVALIFGLAVTIATHSSPAWIGWTIGFAMFILTTTAIPVIEWFNAFELSVNIIVSSSLSFISLLLYCILMFTVQLDGETGGDSRNVALGLLLLFFLYPVVVVGGTALYKWRDDNWQMTAVVNVSLIVCSVLIVAFFTAVAVVFSPWELGATGLVLFAVLISSKWVVPAVRSRFPRFVGKVLPAIVIVLTLGYALAISLDSGRGFSGFSVGWGVVFVVLIVSLVRFWKRNKRDGTVFVFSDNVFPIYEYHNRPGIANPLVVNNRLGYMVYGALFMVLLWAVLATYFIEQTAIGLGILALSIIVTYIFSYATSRLPAVQYADAVMFLSQTNTQNYYDALYRAKRSALAMQLNSEKTLNLNTVDGVESRTDTEASGSNDPPPNVQHDHGPLRAGSSDVALVDIHDEKHHDTETLVQNDDSGMHLVSEEFDDDNEFLEAQVSGLPIAELPDQQIGLAIPWVHALEIRRAMQHSIPTMSWNSIRDMLQLGSCIAADDQKTDVDSDTKRDVEAGTDSAGVGSSPLVRVPTLAWNQVADSHDIDPNDLSRVSTSVRSVPLRRALVFMRLLDRRVNQCFHAQQKFAAHVRFEVFQAAASRRHEQELQILTMLRRTNRGSFVTLEYLQALERNSAEWMALEIEMKACAHILEQEQEDRDRKRREDEAAMRKRREERERQLEEERRIAEAAQQRKLEELRKFEAIQAREQHKLDELRRKAEEEELERQEEERRQRELQEKLQHDAQERKEREEQERIQREQEQKEREEREQAERERLEREREELARRQQEEMDQREREKLELERKAQERRSAELAAQLERERLAREEAERQRQLEFERQEAQRRAQEAELRAQREAEELERKQREAEAERERQELLRRQREQEEKLAKLQRIIDTAYEQNVCTYKLSGATFIPQEWFACIDLGPEGGCCRVCRDVCHSGNDHAVQPRGVGPFYCDCGVSGCLAMKTEEERNKLLEMKDADNPVPFILRNLEDQKQAHYEDADFSPGAPALFLNPQKPLRQWSPFVKDWRRSNEYTKGKPQLFTEPMDADDIRQGSIGDCWFLSAIAVLATKRRDLLRRIFLELDSNPQGVYACRFIKDGKPVTVTVDDRIPCKRSGRGLIPAFSRSSDPNELWVPLIEKAYAKLHGCYEALAGGFVDEALVDMTGGVASRIDLTKPPSKQAIRNGSLWRKLLDYNRASYLLGAGSPAGTDSVDNMSSLGIVQGHAYSILDVQEVDGYKLMKLRNPWGSHEWNGDFSDDDRKHWNRRLRAKLNFKAAADGTFWMTFLDFTLNFEDIYICRLFDDASKWTMVLEERHEFSVRLGNAGGCTNYPTVKNNPQYLLSARESCVVVLTLAQFDVRGSAAKKAAISIEVYNNSGKRVRQRKHGDLVASNPESYIYRREVTCQMELEPMAAPYTVLISTFKPKEECRYWLRAFSTSANVQIEEIQ